MIKMLNTDVQVMQVIVCAKERRGDGKSRVSPIRRIIEVCELDGSLIADNDTYYVPPETVLDFLIHFQRGLIKDFSKMTKEDFEDVVYEYFIKRDTDN